MYYLHPGIYTSGQSRLFHQLEAEAPASVASRDTFFSSIWIIEMQIYVRRGCAHTPWWGNVGEREAWGLMWGGSRWTGGWEEGGGELFSFVACFLSLAAFRCFLVLLSSLSCCCFFVSVNLDLWFCQFPVVVANVACSFNILTSFFIFGCHARVCWRNTA